MQNLEARDFCQKIEKDSAVARNWQITVELDIDREIQATRGARLKGPVLLERIQQLRQMVGSVLAAELFPDSDPPRLIIAETEAETHKTLREKLPSLEPRISGEIFQLINLDLKFFMIDRLFLRKRIGSNFPYIKSKLPESVDWLLNQNIVPVDSICDVVTQELLSALS